MFSYLQKVVRAEITMGVLVAGLFLSGIIWFLAYTQEKVDTFASFSVDPSVVMREEY